MMIERFALAAVCAVTGMQVSASAEPVDLADSVTLGIDANFPDPSFIEADGTYYAFSTGNGFPYASAPSIRAPWTRHSKSMPTRPSWTAQAPSGTWDWAPDLFRRASDGRFGMYYSARDRQSDRQCIGVATSASPAGPYVDDSDHARVCPPSGHSVIDPSPFTNLDGTPWMIYNAQGGIIRGRRGCSRTRSTTPESRRSR